MKYVVILADGMADEPLMEFGRKTPLEYAHTPAMDALASKGTVGLVKTVPSSMKPGSDVANLAVLGYDPTMNYSGRSPLEALSVGVAIESDDVVLRCNLVTLSEDKPFEEKIIIDHSSGEISTQDANVLMDAVRECFNNEDFQFYTGTSYRHITIWKNGEVLDLEQPHDHLGSKVGPYLPEEKVFRQMMEKSFEVLDHHPLNEKRALEGKNKANSLWFWGAGTKPSLQSFYEKTGLKGAMISAVDLLKGIAVGTGMEVVEVDGATGSLDTNYSGKARAAVEALLDRENDFVYVHIEAPDEMGHQGSAESKVRAIEEIDKKIVTEICRQLDSQKVDYRMMILPDHPTPIRCRTHTGDPVPFLLYDSTCLKENQAPYSEKGAVQSGIYFANGTDLMNHFIQRNVV